MAATFKLPLRYSTAILSHSHKLIDYGELMAYQVLSRKWRPKKFQEVVGQEHITRSLQNAIINERLGHAYILTGTRGIGKTSVARLFAKSLRCLNRKEDANSCNECKACIEFDTSSPMNVFEIDGASNNSVDDIRDLIGSIQTLPTFGTYKVYIIDEVHMLSTNAFNALLKTLEEPPAHVVFLLATTEPEKLLNTVLSRCQRFDFRNASVDLLSSHLEEIAEKEGIKFESPFLVKTLAAQGQGSFRDTLSLLDQVLSFSEEQLITERTLTTALGLARISSIRNLVKSVLLYDSAGVSRSYFEMLKENVGVENISRSLIDFLYEVIQNIDELDKLNFEPSSVELFKKMKVDEVFWLYESMVRDLTWAIESLNSEKTVEIVLLKHAKRNQILAGSGLELSSPEQKKKSEIDTNFVAIEESLAPIKKNSISPEEIKKEEIKKEDFKIEQPLISEVSGPETKAVEARDWASFEDFFKNEYPAIYAELEQGNVIENLVLKEEQATVTYGFSGSAVLFYEHLKENEGALKVEESMKNFFNVERATLHLVSLDKEEAKEKNFQSKSEIREKEIEQGLEDTRVAIRNHPVIIEAEKIFNSKIDKIKINEE